MLPVEALYTDIYANTPPLKIRRATADTTIIQPYVTTAQLLKKIGHQPKNY